MAVAEAKPGQKLLVSVVVPFYNEEENVEPLHRKVAEVANKLPAYSFEYIYVNDGSADGTRAAIERTAGADDCVRPIHFKQNAGQSAALYAGFQAASGEYILTLDGDLQNDPADFPAIIELLSDYECVCGYRANRVDPLVRKLSASVANRVRNLVLHDGVRDTGCGTKGYRRSCIPHLIPFNGLHRFTPALLRAAGMSITECAVTHHPRVHGHSKYGIHNRLWRGLFDLIGVAWLRKRYVHPIPESDAEE